MQAFDPAAFRRALGRFATGVTVVTTLDASGQRYGVTANSYNSVSLDPPLVLWSLARTSRALAAFQGSTAFAIHVLGAQQEELAMTFAGRGGEDRFAGLAVRAGHGGAPLLEGCAARFECARQAVHDGGDHVIILGRVIAFERGEGEPLVFHDGRFTRLQTEFV